MTNAPEYSETDLLEITQLARLKFLGEEVAKQVMTEDERIIATMACLKYANLDLDIYEDFTNTGFFTINDKTGFVSEFGFAPPIYFHIGYFSDDYVLFYLKDNKASGFLDKTGRVVIDGLEERFEAVKSFYDGMARVVKDKKCGYIDKTGKLVIGFEFDVVGNFEEGFAIAWRGKKSGWIDKKGKMHGKYGKWIKQKWRKIWN